MDRQPAQRFGLAALSALLATATLAAEPVSFRRHVEAVLSKAGCNAGTCHGSPSGKGGFRLSLRGYDPAADYISLTRDGLGRRLNRERPEASLLLVKALGQVPHGGGRRFGPGGRMARILRDWIAAGAPDDPPARGALARLEVRPRERDVVAPADRQPLTVLARFADGSALDVTDLAVYTSSDETVAEAAESGLVTRKGTGEAAVMARYLDGLATAQVCFLPATRPAWTTPPATNFIDRLVYAKLRRLGIEPSPPADDAEFLRRAALDTIGTVVPPETARAFLESKAPAKRARLIDWLLARPEYADFWALKWSDVLRAARPNMALSEVVKLQRWLRDRMAENTPYDRFARALLTATDTPYDNPAVLFYRSGDTPPEWGEMAAQVFLGIRMQCAKCHNHPFERWTQDQYYELAAFFARLKHNPKRPENRYAEAEGWWLSPTGEQVNPRTHKPAHPQPPGGRVPDVSDGADRRVAFADWLTRPENPYFARAAVNRLWYHLTGRGITEPVDDFRDSNPPSNAPLLDALAADFVAHGYDTKHTIRTILNSRTYQATARPTATNAADRRYFSHALARPLTGEQLLDSLSSATGVPEEFDGLPRGIRAAAVPDIEFNNVFLKSFGMPERLSSCVCERTQETSLAAVLQLVNGESVQRQLRARGGRIDRLAAGKRAPEAVIDELFLAALNRFPDRETRAALAKLVATSPDRRRELRDILWAIVNSREFQYRN